MTVTVALVSAGMADPQHTDPASRPEPAERDYLLRRAEDHRRLAAVTTDVGSRGIHVRLEEIYRARAAGAELVLPD